MGVKRNLYQLSPSFSREFAPPLVTHRRFSALVVSEPKFMADCSTKREKQWVIENFVDELECQGWFIKGCVESIWGGERDHDTVVACSESVNAGIKAVAAAILARAPAATKKKSYQRRESTLRRAGVSEEVISASTNAFDAGFLPPEPGADEGAGQVVWQTQKAPHEIAQVSRALDKNSFFAGLDSDQKAEVIAGVYLELHDAGSILIEQGAFAKGDLDKFYIIKTGRCEVFIDGNRVASLGNGRCESERKR